MEVRLQARARDKHEKATKETLQRLHQVLSTRGTRFHGEYLHPTFFTILITSSSLSLSFFSACSSPVYASTRLRACVCDEEEVGKVPTRRTFTLAKRSSVTLREREREREAVCVQFPFDQLPLNSNVARVSRASQTRVSLLKNAR